MLIKTEIAELSHLVFVNVMKVFVIIKVLVKDSDECDGLSLF